MVLEKVKRLKTEVTAASLNQIIIGVNEENAKQVAAGLTPPPGIAARDPHDAWLGATLGVPSPTSSTGPLIEHSAWNFAEKSRWLYTCLLTN